MSLLVVCLIAYGLGLLFAGFFMRKQPLADMLFASFMLGCGFFSVLAAIWATA